MRRGFITVKCHFHETNEIAQEDLCRECIVLATAAIQFILECVVFVSLLPICLMDRISAALLLQICSGRALFSATIIVSPQLIMCD